jgi:MinD-like ATPase involved in chromosome partitioning or flagellar assembly
MPIIPFISLEGGVGKTVSAVAIAEATATLDKTLRVLRNLSNWRDSAYRASMHR